MVHTEEIRVYRTCDKKPMAYLWYKPKESGYTEHAIKKTMAYLWYKPRVSGDIEHAIKIKTAMDYIW